jgi:hypothetical protein
MSQWPIRIMVYGAGDAINGVGALDSAIQAQLVRLGQVATNPYVAAIAQLDSSAVPSWRFLLDPSGRTKIALQIGEFNTGDPEVLLHFVEWSAALCPARRSILVMSGHGMAWEDEVARQLLGTRGLRPVSEVHAAPGARHHPRRLFGHNLHKVGALTRALLIDGDSRDFLSNAELGMACERIAALLGAKLDVLVFDACLMSSLEIFQEISGSVRTVVASVDELSASGIDLSRPAWSLSVARGELDAPQLAAAFASQFTPQTAFDSCVAIDLASPEFSAALSHFRTFSGHLLPWLQAAQSNLEAVRGSLRLAATSVVRYTSGGLADLGALAAAMAGVRGIPAACVQSLDATVTALRSCILGKSLGRDYASALGLSIFAPNSLTVYSTNRPEYLRLQFPNVSGWGSVLDAVYGFENVYTRFLAPSVPPPTRAIETPGKQEKPTVTVPPKNGAHDTEFLVNVQGLKLDAQGRERLDKALRNAVLQALVDVDLKGALHLYPLSQFAQAQGIELPRAGISGLAVQAEQSRPLH